MKCALAFQDPIPFSHVEIKLCRSDLRHPSIRLPLGERRRTQATLAVLDARRLVVLPEERNSRRAPNRPGRSSPHSGLPSATWQSPRLLVAHVEVEGSHCCAGWPGSTRVRCSRRALLSCSISSAGISSSPLPCRGLISSQIARNVPPSPNSRLNSPFPPKFHSGKVSFSSHPRPAIAGERQVVVHS